jgi:hypothetical protein
LYSGIRAGGGIGDELESPNGDPLELYRIIFDITFFFFIIVILLAIIQGKIQWKKIDFSKDDILGLIIDAFGDLREQLDSVKETLEVIIMRFSFCLLNVSITSPNVLSVELVKIILIKNHMDLKHIQQQNIISQIICSS